VTAGARTRIVDESDAQARMLELGALGEPCPHLGSVDVAVDRLRRRDPPEGVQDVERRQVARVEDELGFAEERDAGVREPAPTARQVGVADDREQAAIIPRARTRGSRRRRRRPSSP
jgi:hypothetical protein